MSNEQSETPPSAIQPAEKTFSPESLAIVEKNLARLTAALIPNNEPNTEESRKARIGVMSGERQFVNDQPGSLLEGLTIIFNPQTGEIGQTDKVISVFRTWLLRVGEKVYQEKPGESNWTTNLGKYTILLHQPGTMPLAHEYTNAVQNTGAEWPVTNPLLSEGRRLLPERLFPEDIQAYGYSIQGLTEKWGTSELMSDASGDFVLLESIKQFNALYGPSLKEDFFRKLQQSG